jgi:hypothetical protein
MTERPILFNGSMVRAILDGRKRVMRQVVKPQPDDNFHPLNPGGRVERYNPLRVGRDGEEYPAPERWGVYDDQSDYAAPCAPGDRLWVRETWAEESQSPDEYPIICYRADGASHHSDKWNRSPRLEQDYTPRKWRPSIHMPRWASRITLDVVSVRVERLQDIDNYDAKLEGVEEADTDECGDYRWSFMELWDSLNAKRGFGWDVNPFVWRIEFEVAK